MSFTDFQKGYLAGLLDGEGSIIVYKQIAKRGVGKRNRSFQGFTLGCNVRIHNTNLDLLNNINQIFLGKLYCSSKKNKTYVWQINDKEKIVFFLQELLPYLIVKKDRAIKAIEFCKSRINRIRFKSPYTKEEEKMAEEWYLVPTNSGVKQYAINV